jgi:hypothetical protein
VVTRAAPKRENRAVTRFPRALCRTRTGDPFLTIESPLSNGVLLGRYTAVGTWPERP